ncbi:SRPBCC family protein [Halobacillus litoralis]|uniref:Cell division protein n=1 Tax=Halobacillus litoralis TaxID=45668 RepID=A0A410MBK4_9BACI|nr:SRPBCC family protein [Halobacillus litoralis]QAS52111.1 cell division protein [Halobacillus litoralis]
MPVIQHEQFIQAPAKLCFDLARDVDIHTKTTGATKEKAVGGVTNGLLEEGDTVTWEATHFGIRQQLTAKVTFMEKPSQFNDVMVRGAFKSFIHTHRFVEKEGGTMMIDTFDYKSPLGVVGVIADKWFLEKYMTAFIISRAEELKKVAENIYHNG